MDKKSKKKLWKNRRWKSRCFHRLKGRTQEITEDYLSGFLDYPVHIPAKNQSFRDDGYGDIRQLD